MSEKIVQLNEEVIKGQLKELVRGSCRFVKHLVQEEKQRKQRAFLSGRANQEGA